MALSTALVELIHGSFARLRHVEGGLQYARSSFALPFSADFAGPLARRFGRRKLEHAHMVESAWGFRYVRSETGCNLVLFKAGAPVGDSEDIGSEMALKARCGEERTDVVTSLLDPRWLLGYWELDEEEPRLWAGREGVGVAGERQPGSPVNDGGLIRYCDTIWAVVDVESGLLLARGGASRGHVVERVRLREVRRDLDR